MDESTGTLLRETASRLFGQLCTPALWRDAETGAWPQAAWNAVAEAGLHQALLPEQAGGFGVPITDALSLLRVAGAHALPLPLAETMLAGWLLANAGLAVPEGALTVAVGGELEAGRLKGSIARVPWARHVRAVAVLAGGQAVLVPAGGWRGEPDENLAREPRDRIILDVVPAAVGPSGVDALRLRALGAAMRALQIAGALTTVATLTTQYAQDRVQFGRPIGKFQAIQQNLAVLAGQTAAASAAADLGAEAVADGMRLLPIAAAKARAGEAAGIAAGIAHQVHGAIGFTFEHRLHFFTKRLWSWRDEFGNEAEWNALLGRHMLRAGADRLWAELVAA